MLNAIKEEEEIKMGALKEETKIKLNAIKTKSIIDEKEKMNIEEMNDLTTRKTDNYDGQELNGCDPSLVQFLQSEECGYLIKDITDTTEQCLHDNHDNDDEIINKLCSDEMAGQFLRSEAMIEKGLDPDARVPFITCETALDAHLVQLKDTFLGILIDVDVCKAEVQRFLNEFKIGGEGDPCNPYPLEAFTLKRGMVICKPGSVKPHD